MNIVIRIILSAVVAFALSYILRGIYIDTFWTALVLAIVLAILNAFVKPILIILTFPLTIFSFGLFLFVINACIILLAGKFVNGFRVDGFWWAMLFSLLLTLLTSLLYRSEEKESRK
jgi:putative membrane protein